MLLNENFRMNTYNLRVLTFCLIVFQSIGIRFFSGQGIILSVLIMALSHKSFKLLTSKDCKILIISFIFLLICKIANPSFSYSKLIYQYSLIISIYLFIIQYRKQPDSLQPEFFIVLKLFTLHAIIGYLLYLIIPGQFQNFSIMNKSLFYFFYVSSGDFMGLPRNTGLFWEPGVFQLAANLYLFYCIKFKKNNYQILIAGIAVLSSFSTVGLLIMVLNILYFIYLKFKSRKISLFNISLLIIAVVFFIPILKGNAVDKMDGENTSGLIRLRDFNIGVELIKEKPILGHGVFDTEYLNSKTYVSRIESEILSEDYLDISDEMSGGFTNGLLGLIAWFGIPVSLFLYFLYFKNKFVSNDSVERLIFCLIPLLSMLSEPIAYTSLFLMFPFSYLILNVSSKYFEKNQLHGLDLNNSCNL